MGAGHEHPVPNMIEAFLKGDLDEPSFLEPICAALFEEDGAAYLVWTRRDVS